jgi:hypothetical protein
MVDAILLAVAAGLSIEETAIKDLSVFMAENDIIIVIVIKKYSSFKQIRASGRPQRQTIQSRGSEHC